MEITVPSKQQPVSVNCSKGFSCRVNCCGRERRYCCCTTKLGCCGCCVLTPVLVIVLLVLAAYLSARAQTFPATKFTNVEYAGVGGVKLHAYLAKPNNASAGAAAAAAPAAIVFHAWNGMSEEAVYFADRLAEQGYYAIAPDLFRNVASEPMNIVQNILFCFGQTH